MAVVAGVVGGLLSVLLVSAFHQIGVRWWGYAAAFLLGAGLVASPIALYASLYAWQRETGRQLRGLINVRPLSGVLPLKLDGWSVDPHFADLVTRLVLTHHPRLVVECGSGTSTVLVAAIFREIGSGRVLSFEHDPDFAEQTRELLRRRDLDAWATVVSAPLVRQDVGGRDQPWYGGAAEQLDAGEEIDLLVVDGPPASAEPAARYPAVPVLEEFFSDQCLILLDDGARESEQRTARRWSRQLPDHSLEYVEGGRGAWMLRPLD